MPGSKPANPNFAELGAWKSVVGQMNPSGIDANESVAHRLSGPPRQIPLQHYGLAILSVGVALGLSLLLEYFHFRVPPALLLLFAVAISSWYGGRGPAVLAGILSTIGFYWYFVEPVRTIYIYRSEIAYFIIFTAFAALLSWFGTIRRRVEADLRERAALLSITHDTVLVMDMDGVIKYWNRAAEERYGWTADQSVGKVVHDLLKTVFPAPLDEIKAEVTRTGRWEGELLHTKKDGSQLVAASRWSLERGKGGKPVAILETNNDVTERKRAEEALRRLNRELRALSNCNETLLRAADEQTLLQEICRIVCEEAGYRMAWVGYAEHDEAKSVRPVAWIGAEEGFLATAGLTWAGTERGCGPTGTAIRSGKTCCVEDFATDPRLAPWRESALLRDFRSGIALPLKDEQANPFGCLSIYSAQPSTFTPEEVRLLEELAGDLAFGITTMRSQAARKRAEQALQQSESYLAEAQRLSRTGSWAFDIASDKYVYVSEEDYRIFGFDPQEALPTREAVFQRIHPEDRDKWKEKFENSLREKADSSDEYRIVLPDGTVKHIHTIRHLVLNGVGDVVKLVGTSVDITERKQAEEALRRSEEYLAEAQRLTHTGSFGYDPGSRETLYWSEELFRIFGLDPQRGIPDPSESYGLLHPEDRDRVSASCLQGFREKARFSQNYRLLLHDGTVKHLEVIWHPVLDKNGELVEYVGTVADVTERKRAEEALRQSEAYLAEAQRLSHTGSWALDASTREYSYWSDEMFRIFGVDPHGGIPIREAMGRRIHPEDASRATAGFEKSLREKVDTSDEYRFLLPDGTVKHIQSIRHPVLNDAGDVVQLVGTFVDITERKRAEEALRRSEAYLTEAQRLAHTGAWANDGAMQPVYWSEEVFRIWGFDPQHGLPTRDQARQRIHPEDLDKYRRAWQRLIQEKVDIDLEFRIVLPGGAVKHLRGIGHPVLNANGEVVEVVGTTVDITERKGTEEALRESERRFRTFVDHAADAFFMVDFEHGTIIDVNRSACESLGYTHQELIGKTALAFDVNPDPAAFESISQRAAAGETVLSDRHWHRRKDGSVFPVEVQTSVFWYHGRRFLVKAARDISDRLRAEEQRDKLRQLETDLAHMNRVSMMGELTASIAHEVNQPLSGVVSNGSACLRWLAGETPNMEEAREAARRIVRDGKRAAEVVARVRAMTRRTEASREKLDLNETIREVLALVGDETKKNRVVIRTGFADDVFQVLGDRVQLQQVMLNLVMNGLEAMSGIGEQARELAIITRNTDSDQVQVTVQDSGKGLDPDTITKIFDPFYTTKPSGMGMGLSISRSILQAHGGQLWAAANDGPGTSFHFTLPRYDEKSHAAA